MVEHEKGRKRPELAVAIVVKERIGDRGLEDGGTAIRVSVGDGLGAARRRERGSGQKTQTRTGAAEAGISGQAETGRLIEHDVRTIASQGCGRNASHRNASPSAAGRHSSKPVQPNSLPGMKHKTK